MLSRKTVMILAVAAVLLYIAVLGISLAAKAAKPGMRVVTERKADPAELLRGGSENEKPGRVMPGDRININTADTEELQRLPGIGAALAEAVAAWREEHGPFAAPEDLMQVPGIGEEIFRAAAEYIITEDPT